MPTPLDNELETHDGPEPKIVATDVQKVLRKLVRPGEESGDGEAVARIAARACVSTRTVYRVLNPEVHPKHYPAGHPEAGKPHPLAGKLKRPAISLDLADRLCLACGVHLAYSCRLYWPDGSITDYVTGKYLIDAET